MKLLLPKIVSTWCGQLDCWPEDHPGCDRRFKRGCEGCEFACKEVVIDGGGDEILDVGERAQ